MANKIKMEVELPGMPPLDECGALGKDYLNACFAADEAKKVKEKCGDALVKKLVDGHRNTIRVQGVTIMLKRLPAADKLTVKHAKDK